MTNDSDTTAHDAARRETRRRRAGAAASVAAALAVVAVVAVAIAWTFPKPPADSPAAPTVSARVTPTAPATVETRRSAPALPAASATATAPAAPQLPLGMAYTLPGSQQMVVATGSRLGATHGTLRVYELAGGAWTQLLAVPCRFGTNGLIGGTQRVQGSRTTPTGIWWPGTFVWGWQATPPVGTSMPYRQTTANVWWSDVRNATYNTWVVSAKPVSGEHLVEVRVQYEYAWSTGYNAPPNTVVRGRGTAIFLHVFDPPDYNNGLSAGCVTVSRDDIVRVFRVLDPALKPSFAIGTETPGTATSISAY